MSTVATNPITVDEFEQMEFERPTELVRGELVEQPMPTSRHGSVCLAVGAALWNWAEETGAGVAFGNDSFVLTERDPDTVRGPDCAFVSRQRLGSDQLPPGTLRFAVDLAVEVLSPSDRETNMKSKVLEYLESGVTEVWVVDPEERTVAVHRADQEPLQFGVADTITRPDLLPGFSSAVARFFRHV
jgi:Uma2 family endonuclease